MSEKLIIPQVLTSPMPWGVKVEWKWPEGSHWFSKLEMQYLHSDGRLEKQVIGWPVTGKAIGGLKAGERLQIRLRPIDKNGAVREWTQGDWIEGVSSSNAEEYLAAFSITAGSDMRLMASFVAPKFKIENGEVFINDAFISEAITAAANLTDKAVTKDDKFNADKVLEDAWKCGCRSIAEGIDALAKAATAYPQDYKQHIVGGETSASTYSVSMGINLNDVQLASGVGINIDGILKNALAHDKAMSDFEEAIRKAIHKESLPGGLIWGQCVASAVHTALDSLEKIMPARAKRPCKHKGCSTATNDPAGYCDSHRQLHAGDGWRNYQPGKSRQERGYGRPWEIRRARILMRDKHLCQDCRRRGIGMKAESVDHIIAKAHGGTDDDSNLESLCWPCHRRKTAKERLN